jgi:hypothetical protein
VVINKSRLVAQGFSQKEGIDYKETCNTPPTKAAPPSPSVGASTRTHSTLLTLPSSLHVKGLTLGWYGWWTKAYKLAPPLLN